MTAMLRDGEALRRRLYIGLAKERGESAIALCDLALLAARVRFDRRPPPSGTELPSLHLHASLVPEATRPLLARLCGPQAPDDSVALATADLLRRAELSPHPFDFTRMEDFVVRHAGLLGRAAQEWAAIVRSGRTEDRSGDEPVTEETLGSASRAAKLGFLSALRRQDPPKARAVMERLFAAESASGRGDFLDILASGLDEADLPFLTAAGTDRAQTVRNKAQALVARIPGTGLYGERLTRLRDYLKVKKGLLRGQKLTVSGLEKQAALFELLDGLRLNDIARALELETDMFLALAADAAELAPIILGQVMAERRFARVELFADLLKDHIHLAANLLDQALPFATPDDRALVINLCVVPDPWAKTPDTTLLQYLYGVLREPLPRDLAQLWLGSAGWRELCAQAAENMTVPLLARIAAVAPLVPRALSQRFLDETARIAPRAADFHRFVLALPERGP
jgi:hypothetical protein